jgi:hypothetical protein
MKVPKITTRLTRAAAAVGLAVSISLAAPCQAATPGELLRTELEAGRAAAAVTALKPLAANSDEARLALGFAQFAGAVETLMQGLHRHGFQTPQNSFVPIMRLPVPQNFDPKPIDYATLRAIYQTFLDDLATTRKTLAQVKSTNSKIVLDLSAIHLAVPAAAERMKSGPVDAATKEKMRQHMRRMASQLGGGQSDERIDRHVAEWASRMESGEFKLDTGLPLASVIQSVSRGASGKWEVAFDRSDALWLQGYTHMLAATVEFVMAHDWSQTFDATGNLFFTGAKAPAGQATQTDPVLAQADGIVDQIAFLHLIHWPAGDLVRMMRVREHLKSAVALSRETWKAILAETDDDREWLPSPKQVNRAVPTMPITEEMVTTWLAVLDDVDALLDGRKLLAHWRYKQGVDMRMVFEQPQPFDLVLWATGHGAKPFLKDGPTVSRETWQRWTSGFGGNLLGYAFFIN